MKDILLPSDFPRDQKQLPSGLNILTILTFVGSGLWFFSALWQFSNAKKGLERMEKMMNSDKFDEMPAIVKSMMSPEALEVARKSYESRLPMLLITLLGIGLCVFGAMQMRKLKRSGYFIYVIGEILPVFTPLIFIGVAAYSGFALVGLLLPAVFIILYTLQRKYLTNP